MEVRGPIVKSITEADVDIDVYNTTLSQRTAVNYDAVEKDS